MARSHDWKKQRYTLLGGVHSRLEIEPEYACASACKSDISSARIRPRADMDFGATRNMTLDNERIATREKPKARIDINYPKPPEGASQ